MKVIKRKWISREYVQSNRDFAFLFGDNLLRYGKGGQAKEMRGEPNAFGIAVKNFPRKTDSAYFTDDLFLTNKALIDADIQKVIDSCFDTVVIPSDGIGTGLAEMDKRAPRTFAYLQMKLESLENS